MRFYRKSTALLEAQNMVGFRFFCAVVLVAMIAIPSTAKSRGTFRDARDAPADAQSNQEFRAQVAAIVQSYRKGDTTGGRQLIEQFRLPNAKDWLSEHLNPADSAKLVSRYDRVYGSFAESFERTVEDIVAARGAELGTEVELGYGESPAGDFIGKRTGVVSTKPVSLFFCTFQITIKNSPGWSWGETYVHQDGAFRFLGLGGWPFWVWQDGTDERASKASHFGTPAVLISRVDPDYPLQAKALKIEGVVVVRIRIDKDGRVEKAEVISGDPHLSQAALDAVRHWRYKPATTGGIAVGIDGRADVVFSLHH
jgi:TonB family protein